MSLQFWRSEVTVGLPELKSRRHRAVFFLEALEEIFFFFFAFFNFYTAYIPWLVTPPSIIKASHVASSNLSLTLTSASIVTSSLTNPPASLL